MIRDNGQSAMASTVGFCRDQHLPKFETKRLPALCTTLERLHIRRADDNDLDSCNRIARLYPQELGWVRRDSLADSCKVQKLHVATIDGIVRGFVEFSQPSRGSNKAFSVIYHLAVEKGWGGLGIGRNLVYSVPTPIRLKVTADNRALRFYESIGFTEYGQSESSSGRSLIHLQRNMLFIWVQGSQIRTPKMARAVAAAYGTRHTEKPHDYPFMLDIHWKKYDWDDYIDKLTRWGPVMAMVADYESPKQRDLMLSQVNDLRKLGVIRIMVCPKFHGAVADIPTDCTVAISVPSDYAGFVPELSSLHNRDIHLLGGAPDSILDLIKKLNGVGARVRSVDANCFSKGGMYRRIWSNGRWSRTHVGRDQKKVTDQLSPYECMQFSAANFQRALEYSSHYSQPELL